MYYAHKTAALQKQLYQTFQKGYTDALSRSSAQFRNNRFLKIVRQECLILRAKSISPRFGSDARRRPFKDTSEGRIML